MAEITGVRWVPNDGEPVVFDQARGFHTDGYGDYQFTADGGAVIATRKRSKTDHVECVFDDQA